jgi:tetratricopeptide (TPR) repeat protein
MGLAVMITALNSFGQCSVPDFGQDREKAEVMNARYSDALREGKFKEAKGPLVWLLNNAPKLTTKIYIDGADIYEALADKENDDKKKEVLVDSMLLMYDLRVKSCGEEDNVMNRKANGAFKYFYKNVTRQPELLQLYDKAYELNGNNLSDPSITLYMNVVYLNAKYAKSLNVEQVLDRYDKISAIIDAKTKVAMERNKQDLIKKYNGYKTTVDDLFIKAMTDLDAVNCDFVKKNMEPKYRQNTKDLDLVKKMFMFMTTDKCFDDPLWLELGDILIKTGEAQDFGLYKNVAIKYIANGNFERGEALIKEALSLATDPKDKSEILTIMGGFEVKRNLKSAARDLYLQANKADPSNLDALSKIGDLYMNSFDDCKKLKSKAEGRAASGRWVRGGRPDPVRRPKRGSRCGSGRAAPH